MTISSQRIRNSIMKKKNIALFCGGDSSECEVSLNSAVNVFKYIDTQKFMPYLVLMAGTKWSVVLKENGEPLQAKDIEGITAKDILNCGYLAEIDKTRFAAVVAGETVKFDKVFVMIHGKPGENGPLQGYLEMMGIPFTTCSSFVSAITFDKYSCKRFLDYAGVKMAKDVFIRRDVPYSVREIVRRVGLPMFVKPTVGGSSFGVTKVKCEEEVEAAIRHAFTECDMVIAEEAIEGREITNGVYKVHGSIRKLPVTEIVTDREYFDYEAKYLGKSDEICPAPLDADTTSRIQNMSERIYSFMGCSGVVRIDYILTKEGDIYFLEVNTVPGMTKESLIPRQVEVAGLELKDFISQLLD